MMSSDPKITRILVMAGGTGGHVFPALAVATELSKRGMEICWLGTRRGLESEVVPKAGINISYINVTGLRGNGILGWLSAPVKLFIALLQSIAVVRKVDPVAVLGMGGFVTGPGALAAWLLRRPLIIHEQNAIAGLTNRLLIPFASHLLEAFPNTLKANKILHTGNPVREYIGGDEIEMSSTENIKLLVVGGSLGAQALNKVVPDALEGMEINRRPQIWHQTGKRNIDETLNYYKEKKIIGRVDAFIDDMAHAYTWADLVLCRAGALTIAELAMAGVASILVPFPFAVDDHQTFNAQYLSEPGASILIRQTDLTPDTLRKLLDTLDNEKLNKMARIARTLAMPNATSLVADQCMEAAQNYLRKVA
jgi:UDP-N-acetylglucosamine--N-acetylmuramyl-(pentapeptide) pyrophosphoryl-undecaprenol N-acetylglucosamine transferase